MKIKIMPKNIYIEVTNQCNAKCMMCPNDKITREKGIMTLELFKNIIDQLKGVRGVKVFLHKEGEPLIDKNLSTKIRYAKDILGDDNEVIINTNGYLLTDEMSRELIDSGLDTIFFSVDSISKELYESIRSGLDYNKVVSNIEQFCKLNGNKVHTVLQMLTYDGNRHEIDGFKKKWDGIASEIFIKEMHSYLDGGHTSMTMKKSDRQIAMCNDPLDTIVIYWNGKVGACCWDYDNTNIMGSVLEESIINIFNGIKFNNLRSLLSNFRGNEIDPCSRCLRIFGKDNIKGISSVNNDIII